MPHANNSKPATNPKAGYANYQENRPFPTPQSLEREHHSGSPLPPSLNSPIPPKLDDLKTPLQALAPSAYLPPLDTTPSSVFLDTMGVALSRWTLGLGWKRTTVQKAGLINKIIKKKQLLDLDLSCLLFDEKGQILERVWFKNVRDNAEFIRYRGDNLDGFGEATATDKNSAKNSATKKAPMRPNLSRGNMPVAPLDHRNDQETMDIFLTKIPPQVHFITFVVSSFHGQAFQVAGDAYCHLSDDEGNTILQLDLAKLPEGCRAIWVATLSRELVNQHNNADLAMWQFTANKQPLSFYQLAHFEQEISQYLQNMLRGKFLPTV